MEEIKKTDYSSISFVSDLQGTEPSPVKVLDHLLTLKSPSPIYLKFSIKYAMKLSGDPKPMPKWNLELTNPKYQSIIDKLQETILYREDCFK